LPQALRAANVALEQFPYSIDLTIEKTDVLIKKDENTEALQLLEQTLNIHPNDPELLIQKGAIHCLQSEFEDAIEA
jgi:tetratricopeptide (TPR) repeat protein